MSDQEFSLLNQRRLALIAKRLSIGLDDWEEEELKEADDRAELFLQEHWPEGALIWQLEQKLREATNSEKR